MLSNSYINIFNIARSQQPIGGVCAVWFVPIQDIAYFPKQSPTTGYLDSQIGLKQNKEWFGPISLTYNTTQSQEQHKYAKPGTYYLTSVEGTVYGHSQATWLNLNSLAGNKYVVVAKLRNNNLYTVIGTPTAPATLQLSYNSGVNSASEHKLIFTTESFFKSPLLASFKPCFVPTQAANDYGTGYSDDY